MKVLFNIVTVLLVWQITSPARPRTLAQGQGLNPQGQGQGLDLQGQGQGQGVKICPRGQLKAKDHNTGISSSSSSTALL